MSAKQKSQRGFVAVTLITVLSIALVIVAYAILLGTFYGGEVTVGTLQGQVSYSLNNSTKWSANLYNVTGGSWYAKLNNTGSYKGPVSIIWQLQNKTVSGWVDWSGKSVTTSFTLDGSNSQNIYASSDGLPGSNRNWGQDTTSGGPYRIKVTINTP